MIKIKNQCVPVASLNKTNFNFTKGEVSDDAVNKAIPKFLDGLASVEQLILELVVRCHGVEERFRFHRDLFGNLNLHNVQVVTQLEGRKDMFYLTMHSTHFYLRLYGVGHMVKDHSESKRKPNATTWATLSD